MFGWNLSKDWPTFTLQRGCLRVLANTGLLSHKSVVRSGPFQNYLMNYIAHCVHYNIIIFNKTAGQVNVQLKYTSHNNMNMLSFHHLPTFAGSRTVFMYCFNIQIMLHEGLSQHRKHVEGHNITHPFVDTQRPIYRAYTYGRQTCKHTCTDYTCPYRSRASLTSSFALECVVAKTLL